MRRLIYLGVGWLGLGMAVAGVILPILPTTPMLLVAVWAFGKSSPELAEKIRNHRVFGPPVRDWQDHGVISTSAKLLAITVMALMGAWLWIFGSLPVWLTALISAVMIGAGLLWEAAQAPQGSVYSAEALPSAGYWSAHTRARASASSLSSSFAAELSSL